MDDWIVEAEAKIANMPQEALEVRERALVDLPYFARLVNPGYMYGSIHDEIFRWLQEYDLFGMGDTLSSNKLVMLPRAHLKSHIVATWCAWLILRHPEVTILYVSATAELAQTQLFAIQNILGSTLFRRFFPEYVHPQEGKRERWSVSKLSVDHKKRASEGVRDATIATAGLTTNTTGWHADIVVADDLVVPENAYTEEGRTSVSRKASQFTSIRNAGGFTVACGTRYHPADVYQTWKDQFYDDYCEKGILIDTIPVWEVKEYVVEEDGIFLWPRRVRGDGKAFGFDTRILARIKAEYTDFVQFFAQYYNNPNAPGAARIDQSKFQYFNPRLLKREGGRWFYSGKRLNIYAAVDFAFSLSKKADFTAIVVIGIDADSNVYVLDIDRFKTDKTLTYFEHIAKLHAQWGFKKLRAEVSVAQKVIVNAIKDYVKAEGLTLPVDEHRPTRAQGSKETRIAAVLEHKYDNHQMYHYEGGWTPQLEEELISVNPRNDDVKDALASAVEIAIPPNRGAKASIIEMFKGKPQRNSRFGGVVSKGNKENSL